MSAEDRSLLPQRCGAKTRSGKPCPSAPANGYRRCRMHGGAKGSGAPKGNRNAYKHGGYTKESLEELRRERKLLRAAIRTIGIFDEAGRAGGISEYKFTDSDLAAMQLVVDDNPPIFNGIKLPQLDSGGYWSNSSPKAEEKPKRKSAQI